MILLSPSRKFQSSTDLGIAKKGFGKPSKLKRGCPKVLNTTWEKQGRAAKNKYSETHPEKNYGACPAIQKK